MIRNCWRNLQWWRCKQLLLRRFYNPKTLILSSIYSDPILLLHHVVSFDSLTLLELINKNFTFIRILVTETSSNWRTISIWGWFFNSYALTFCLKCSMVTRIFYHWSFQIPTNAFLICRLFICPYITKISR